MYFFGNRRKATAMTDEQSHDREIVPTAPWPHSEPEMAAHPGMSRARDLDISPYAPKEPLPAYVKPRGEVPPVGALSAEALLRDYEKTAKQVEQMGAELAGATRKCAEELNLLGQRYERLVDYVKEVTAYVDDTAEAIRDEAKRVFLQIENTTLMTQEMRDLSEQMRGRVAGEQKTSTQFPNVQHPSGVNIIELEKSVNQVISQVEEELNKARDQSKEE